MQLQDADPMPLFGELGLNLNIVGADARSTGTAKPPLEATSGASSCSGSFAALTCVSGALQKFSRSCGGLVLGIGDLRKYMPQFRAGEKFEFSVKHGQQETA